VNDGHTHDDRIQDDAYWADRRIYERVDVTLNCSVRDDLDRSVTGLMMKNLSLGGCYVITSFPLPEGKEVALTLALPELERELRFHGLVVWSRAAADGKADGSNGMGVEFSDVDTDDLALLRRYLTELTKEGELE
jgi:uncharacterized protein (TIGR02266 family)